MRQTAASKIMNEVAEYGGLPMRRADILTLATEDMGEHAEGKYGAMWTAMHGEAVDCEPMTLEEAREVCNGGRWPLRLG